MKNSDKDIFDKSRNVLNKTGLITSNVRMMTPLEQLLYVTPFDKEGKYMFLFDDYSDKLKNKIIKVISEIFGNSEYKNLYPNIKEIAETVYNNDTNSEIDCRGAVFLNKCVLKIVHNAITIKQDDFIDLVRGIIPVAKQTDYKKLEMTGGVN